MRKRKLNIKKCERNILEISHKTHRRKSNPSHEPAAPITCPRFHLLYFACSSFLPLRISLRYLRSLSLLLNLVYPARWAEREGGKGSCGGAGRTPITINNNAAAAPSRIAFVSSDVLLPSLVEKKPNVFLPFFFFCHFLFFWRFSRRLIPLGFLRH